MKGGKGNKTLKRGGLLSTRHYSYGNEKMYLQQVIDKIKKDHEDLESTTKSDRYNVGNYMSKTDENIKTLRRGIGIRYQEHTKLERRVNELEQKILSNTVKNTPLPSNELTQQQSTQNNPIQGSGGGRTKKYRKKIKKSNTIKKR